MGQPPARCIADSRPTGCSSSGAWIPRARSPPFKPSQRARRSACGDCLAARTGTLATGKCAGSQESAGKSAGRIHQMVCERLCSGGVENCTRPSCVLSGSLERLLRKVPPAPMMQIQGITLREISMKLVVPFETSMDRLVVRRIVLLEAHVDGVTGWGECVAAEAPFYSPEYADTAWPVLRDFLWPMVKGRKFDSACEVWNLLTRVRGHNMAKACLEASAWEA